MRSPRSIIVRCRTCLPAALISLKLFCALSINLLKFRDPKDEQSFLEALWYLCKSGVTGDATDACVIKALETCLLLQDATPLVREFAREALIAFAKPELFPVAFNSLHNPPHSFEQHWPLPFEELPAESLTEEQIASSLFDLAGAGVKIVERAVHWITNDSCVRHFFYDSRPVGWPTLKLMRRIFELGRSGAFTAAELVSSYACSGLLSRQLDTSDPTPRCYRGSFGRDCAQNVCFESIIDPICPCGCVKNSFSKRCIDHVAR